ncbi:MAG: CotH kinase family protein, partial [Bacteroidota bacterium]
MNQSLFCRHLVLILLFFGGLKVGAQVNLPFSSPLPIVHIQTLGADIQDEPKVQVRFQVIDNGPGQINISSDSANGYDGFAGVEYRGNSTLQLPGSGEEEEEEEDPEEEEGLVGWKNSMGVELWTANGEDTSAVLMGLPEEEDWVLHASFFDRSFLRNDLSFEIWRKMGHWGPRTRFCELVVDGQYEGVYILMEKIKRDKNRLDLAKLKSTDVSGDELTGGYILRLDWADE